ncbi:extracellular solute-binding protein [Cohnella sp. REN36]|uniref:extracellular solute-binding protein n=1 Tax=Cohnella sp. REN36 TaxID=2887347 RepID=UPI001D156593|nr:extracellular solute-binding protein [Cohnella sp. REN36]MCC3372282.1 extracellular solute-binding protein [Cohnella sp. REN36]
MKNRKFFVFALAAILLLTVILSACSGTSEGGSKTGTGEGKAAAPTKITMLVPYFSTEPPTDDNVVVVEAEKRTNTDLKITWSPVATYEEKVNVTLAGGDLPDLITVLNPFTPQVRKLVQQGAFWDLTPFFKDYPNLMKFPEETYTNTKMQDGKNYGIPRVRPTEGGGQFPYIRKDWLDKLGLPVPETLDDLYQVMKAFANNDMGGNGNTIALAGPLDFVYNVMNGTSGWFMVKDGQLVHAMLEPGTRDALVWLNKAYKEKLIPQDFPALKFITARDMMAAGKVGIFSDTVAEAWRTHQEQLKVNPKADFLPLVSLTGPFGPYNFRDTGHYGMHMIPKSVPEKKVRAILQFMDYGASDEGAELGSYGFKGIHFTEENGMKLTTEQAMKDNVSQQAFGQLFINYDKYMRAYFAGMPPEILERNKQIIDARAEISVPDPASGLYSETKVTVGPEYDKKIDDLRTKIIMGKAPIEAWDTFTDELRKDPKFQKMIQELNDSYQKRVKGQ